MNCYTIHELLNHVNKIVIWEDDLCKAPAVQMDFYWLRWVIASNGHKYPQQKQRTPNLTSFAKIGLAIMFTTNSCVKHWILHVLRDADAISHVKTGEINVDVLIAVIRKCNF